MKLLNNRSGNAIIIFVLGLSAVMFILIQTMMAAPQANLKISRALYQTINLQREVMEEIQTRMTCAGQHYNPDRIPWTRFTCTAGSVVNLYGVPYEIRWGAHFPTEIISSSGTSTLPSSRGRAVRAICLGPTSFQIELYDPKLASFKTIGAIQCP